MQLVMNNMNKYYGKKQVLYDYSMEIELNNIIYGLVGPNGSGKTTVLKLLTGLLIPNYGKIYINKFPENNYIKWAQENVSFIPSSERGLYFKNTVFDNVIYYGVLKGANTGVIKNNIEKYSSLLGIESLLNNRVEQLSTGEKKKAAILSGLCSNTNVLILDEPSLGIDIDSTIDLHDILKKVAEELNITIIITSHDINFLSVVANNVTFIFNGRNVFNSSIRMNENEIIKTYTQLKEKNSDKKIS